MKNLLIAGAGGFFGSAARFAATGFLHRLFPLALIPVGTLFVNVTGSFVIGFLGGLSESRQVFSPEGRVFVFIGILGGFTTFSSFSFETLNLARDADFARASMNIILQVVICLVSVWAGNSMGRAI